MWILKDDTDKIVVVIKTDNCKIVSVAYSDELKLADKFDQNNYSFTPLVILKENSIQEFIDYAKTILGKDVVLKPYKIEFMEWE